MYIHFKKTEKELMITSFLSKWSKKREKGSSFCPYFQEGELNLLFLICICLYNTQVDLRLLYIGLDVKTEERGPKMMTRSLSNYVNYTENSCLFWKTRDSCLRVWSGCPTWMWWKVCKYRQHVQETNFTKLSLNSFQCQQKQKWLA